MKSTCAGDGCYSTAKHTCGRCSAVFCGSCFARHSPPGGGRLSCKLVDDAGELDPADVLLFEEMVSSVTLGCSIRKPAHMEDQIELLTKMVGELWRRIQLR